MHVIRPTNDIILVQSFNDHSTAGNICHNVGRKNARAEHALFIDLVGAVKVNRAHRTGPPEGRLRLRKRAAMGNAIYHCLKPEVCGTTSARTRLALYHPAQRVSFSAGLVTSCRFSPPPHGAANPLRTNSAFPRMCTGGR